MNSRNIPFGFARSEQVAVDDGNLLIGPGATSFGMREILRRGFTGLTPVRMAADEFERAIAEIYGKDTPDGGDVLFELDDAEDHFVPARDLLEDTSDAPVIRLVNQLLRKAVHIGASDLHFEPHENGLRVRARLDGFLSNMFDQREVPVARVVSRLKVMAGLDIAETRLPQDGRISLRVGGRAIDARVSTLPGNFGERVVLRILDRNAGLKPLGDLGLSAEQIAVLERLSGCPDGIILATGPTGSGKTTTLYSLLKLANRAERNLITVEDPIEYHVDGLNQTQINASIGMTFAAGLRAALRQDPDVILVGEIRDQETAAIAGQAALTGHLVFSSLHANTAVGAVVRLRDLGLEDYLIAATLRGVIAQRLLRLLCADCSSRRPLDETEAAAFSAEGVDPPDLVAEAGGCAKCGNSGYKGRIGIYDIVEIDDDLRGAIERAGSETELRVLARRHGTTLAREALRHVAQVRTTLAEVDRALGARA
ncbi:GspE/PulE family protein [Sulfitobacter sp. D35]|uniref:GspE/PulE family protein n=1 Tax=Sulfitobacter sp. D35 TaxID=3083252 RepID=UPI00296FABBB|nr:GspE/PulE family protein [Sulfitobacter sp. D35]MDW4500493.1 GspE/PulE family protein [Sulfitobacter sp. D35]